MFLMIPVLVQKDRPLGGSTPPLDQLGSILWLTWLFTRTLQWTLMEDLTVTTVNVISQKPLGIKQSITCVYCDDLYFSYVENFATSNEEFIQEFSKVYTKLLSHGYDNLQNVI